MDLNSENEEERARSDERERKCAAAARTILNTKEKPKRLKKELEDALKMNVRVVTSEEGAKIIQEESPSELPIISRECRKDGVEGLARALFALPPSITLCSNRLFNRQDIEESLMHEMTHAYDYLVRKMDLMDCDQLACSEIRANREGECQGTWIVEYFRRACTKSNAINATESIFPEKAKECVLRMFEKCYKDAEPIIGDAGGGDKDSA